MTKDRRRRDRSVGPINTPRGLAPPHPESAARGLGQTLRASARALRAHAAELAAMPPGKARTVARAIVRMSSAGSSEAIAKAGARLERSTRSLFEGAMSTMLAAAARRPRGDKTKRRTTIELQLPRGGTPKLIAPPADEHVEAWAKKAAKLVRGVEDEVVEGIARDVAAALEEGTSPAELAARWRSEGLPLDGGGRLESRLELIAQNQLGRLNGELARSRSRAAGLTQQRWVTMGDSRVRETHRAREGKVYDVDEGIGGVFPGDEPNCRCHGESVVTDDDLDRLLGLDE